MRYKRMSGVFLMCGRDTRKARKIVGGYEWSALFLSQLLWGETKLRGGDEETPRLKLFFGLLGGSFARYQVIASLIPSGIVCVGV